MHATHVGRLDSGLLSSVKSDVSGGNDAESRRAQAAHELQHCKSRVGSAPPKELFAQLVSVLANLGVENSSPRNSPRSKSPRSPRGQTDDAKASQLDAAAADAVADAGRVALRLVDVASEDKGDFSATDALDLAKRCARRAGNAKDAPAAARVKLDLLKCLLLARELDGVDAVLAPRGRSADESRRRRGCHVDIPGCHVDIPSRQVAATPRLPRGYFVETSRGGAVAAVWIRRRELVRGESVAPTGTARGGGDERRRRREEEIGSRRHLRSAESRGGAGAARGAREAREIEG